MCVCCVSEREINIKIKGIIIIKVYIALNKQHISLYRNWTCWRVPPDNGWQPLVNNQ